MKKTICFSIPCYNEEENVEPLVEEILKIFKRAELQKYKCSIEFIDNHSTDNTRYKLRMLCDKYSENVKVIFNARNFGGVSNYYGLLQTKGESGCRNARFDRQIPPLSPPLPRESIRIPPRRPRSDRLRPQSVCSYFLRIKRARQFVLPRPFAFLFY